MWSKFLNSLQSVSVLFTAVLVLGSATLYAQPTVTVVMKPTKIQPVVRSTRILMVSLPSPLGAS